MANVVEMGGECDCTTAEEFLDKLSPRHPLWQPSPSTWMFRGQCGDWPLLPKAYRDNGAKFADYAIRCYIKPSKTIPEQSAYDTAFKQLINRFRTDLNDSGLAIPAPSPRLFEWGRTPQKPSGQLSSDATPLLALAQHFGLPTPLLDWTTRPYVAAYFALPLIWTDTNPLIVWAIRRDSIPLGIELKEAGFDDEAALMTVETAPRASNPNLHAQSGLFTLIDGKSASEYTVAKYMEAVVAKLSPDTVDRQDWPFMRKLTLPYGQSKALRKLLTADGINGASMFPGYDGVVRAMRERALW